MTAKTWLPMEDITPNPLWVRHTSNAELEPLAQDMVKSGQIEPIDVCPSPLDNGKPWMIVHGHRRFLALQINGDEKARVRCQTKKLQPQTAAAMCAKCNIQQRRLTPFEKAENAAVALFSNAEAESCYKFITMNGAGTEMVKAAAKWTKSSMAKLRDTCKRHGKLVDPNTHTYELPKQHDQALMTVVTETLAESGFSPNWQSFLSNHVFDFLDADPRLKEIAAIYDCNAFKLKMTSRLQNLVETDVYDEILNTGALDLGGHQHLYESVSGAIIKESIEVIARARSSDAAPQNPSNESKPKEDPEPDDMTEAMRQENEIIALVKSATRGIKRHPRIKGSPAEDIATLARLVAEQIHKDGWRQK